MAGQTEQFQQTSKLQKGPREQQQKVNVSLNSTISLTNTIDNFVAGKTRFHVNNWLKLTNDKWILQTICGYHVELTMFPDQKTIPKPLKFDEIEQDNISVEINRFLKCGIIEEVQHASDNEYISNIFTRPKKEGKIRVILNLKQFNSDCMENIHFKMETLKHAVDSMRRDCYFASVDISEAFYTIPIRKEDRRYFRFYHNSVKYQFTALVMGLTTSPRVYTKVMKPVFAHLRARGFISSAYIDDSCLQGSSWTECHNNVVATVELMDSLGLTVHPNKSVFNPCKQITFLGFILCSETMSVRLTQERIDELVMLCSDMIRCKAKITIRQFAKLIGKMVATEQGVEYAPLFYKPLERVKDKYLRLNKGDFNKLMKIPSHVKPDIQWWITNLPASCKLISHGQPSIVLFSDASLKGWGAVNKTTNTKTGGQWSLEEQSLHINILELKACQLALLSLCKDTSYAHVKIFMDNTTSCSYIRKFGGKKLELDKLARAIWSWCLEKHIHLSAAHVPGISNSEADEMSRSFNDDLEWSLSTPIFDKIQRHFPDLSIDLFASRLNNKLEKYVSYRPEPNAFAIDAFSFQWTDELLFIFSPFSLIPRILQKLEEDQAEAVMITPLWTTQVWWASLLQLISGPCFSLPRPQIILHLPHKPDRLHPLKKMRLGVFRLSGDRSKAKAFLQQQSILSWNRGVNQQRNNTMATSSDGFLFVGTTSIPFNHL